MASGKKTSRSTSQTRGKQSQKNISKKQNNDDIEILAILLMAASVFLFLCNFDIVGSFGLMVKKVMFGLFGILSYVLPFVMLFTILVYILNKKSSFVKRKIVAIVLLVLSAGILIELFTFNLNETEGNIFAWLYKQSSEQFKGGGLIAGMFAYLLNHYLSKVGTVLVVLVIALISFVIITEKSFINGVRRGSEKVYKNAVRESERRNERRAKEREKRALEQEEPIDEKPEPKRRMDKKVTDSVLNVTIEPESKKASPFTGENLHEITIDDVPEQEPVEYVSLQSTASKIEPRTEVTPNTLLDSIPEPKGMVHTPVVEKPKAVVKEHKEPKESKEPVAITPKPVKNGKSADKYVLPPTSLLNKPDPNAVGDSPKQLKETALRLQQTLEIFGVKATITDISKGPAVTRYELQPELGVKVSKIVSLADDIKLNLAATDIRIEAPIPGKAAIGIEVPNKENTSVCLRELLESQEFKNNKSNIAFAVGKDLSGQVVVSDIKKMLHVLIAGATGSGKSVCINTLIMSILYKANPEDVKLIMIDPKVVELSVFNGIPHLLLPVVTDPKKAAGALHWGVEEMTRRYQIFADYNVKDLEHYNNAVESLRAQGDENAPAKLPQIVIIVDELADLMMVAQQSVEESICRLAQLARAAGIHLIIATQRPSVDVITGLIKANMPSRIAFSVASGVDSRTILDMNGAEKLLGKGDMLFYPTGSNKPSRVQGAFVSDKEVVEVVDFIKSQNIIVSQSEDMTSKISAMQDSGSSSMSGDNGNDFDAYFVEAGRFIIEKNKASIGMLQRAFKIGFNRAARIMDQLCDAGVVSEEESTKPRNILMTMEQFEEYVSEYV